MAIYGFMATDMTAIAAGNGLDAGQLGASIWPALLVYRSEKRPTRATCRMANQTLWGHFQCRFWGGVVPELSLMPPPPWGRPVPQLFNSQLNLSPVRGPNSPNHSVITAGTTTHFQFWGTIAIPVFTGVPIPFLLYSFIYPCGLGWVNVELWSL